MAFPELTKTAMPILDESLVSTPIEEFHKFAEQRIEGLQLTEDEATLKLYEAAKALGLDMLKSKGDES